jgi:hypothetical protein
VIRRSVFVAVNDRRRPVNLTDAGEAAWANLNRVRKLAPRSVN